MDLEIKILFEKLKQKTAAESFSDLNNISIRAVKLLKKMQTSFQSDILYIGKISDLSDSIQQENVNVNLLCIADINILPDTIMNNKAVNFIQVADCMDIIDLFNEVQDMLLDRQRFITSSATLLNSIIRGKGLQYIIEIAYELLGNPVVLVDSSYKLLACSRNIEVDDPLWNELVTQGYCSYNFISIFKSDKLIEKTAKSKAPIIIDWSVAEKIRRICAKITIGKKVIGHFAILEYNKPFKESDIELAALICDVISSEMQKYSHFRNLKGATYENFIIDILDGKITNPEALERLKHLDWEMKDKLYLLLINMDRYDPTHSLIPYMRDSLEKMIDGARAVAYNNYIVVIIGCSKESHVNKENLQSLIEFLRKNKMRAALSQCFNNITELQKYYKQSASCMKAGYKVNKNDVLYIYDDYAIHLMINICSKHQDITDFCHPALIKLMEYDRAYKTNYIESLHAYIIHARNLISAADSLFIHRNTMSYRIAKIQEIAEINFNNDNLLMHLYVSYKILEYTGKI